PTLASATVPSTARSNCTLPFLAVTTASAFSPAAPPADDPATPDPEPSRLQAGTARNTARSATARIARLYESRRQLCKFHLRWGCAFALQERQLVPAPRPPERRCGLVAVKTLVHPEAFHRRVEKSARRLRVRSFSAAPHTPAGVVQLAAARIAHAVEHAICPQRQRLAQSQL